MGSLIHSIIWIVFSCELYAFCWRKHNVQQRYQLLECLIVICFDENRRVWRIKSMVPKSNKTRSDLAIDSVLSLKRILMKEFTTSPEMNRTPSTLNSSLDRCRWVMECGAISYIICIAHVNDDSEIYWRIPQTIHRKCLVGITTNIRPAMGNTLSQ